MPKVYYCRDELGVQGPFHSTLKGAQDEFQYWIDQGCEPAGVDSIEYPNRPSRVDICRLLNLFRQENDHGF